MGETTTGTTRRAFLGTSGAAALTLAVPGVAGATARTVTAPASARPAPLHLPGKAELWKHVEMLAARTPVTCGGEAQRWLVDWTEAQFRTAGLQTHRQTYRMAQCWELQSPPALRLDSGRELHVSGFQPWSGQTPADGVTAPLVYAGLQGKLDYTGAAGKIAVIDVRTGTLPLGALFKLDGTVPASARKDWPAAERNPVWDFVFAPKLAEAKAAGAVGVVLVLADLSDAAAEAQQFEFLSPPQGIPALILGRTAGAELRTAAQQGGSARLTLHAVLAQDVPTDNLWAVLPGRTKRVTIVNTHTDGCNALEENGPIALAAMARHFAKVPRAKRENTLVFLAATGHFGHGQIDGTARFVEDQAAIVKRTQATVTVEHLGAMEWVDDPKTGVYGPTGRPHWAVAFSQAGSPLHATLLRSAHGTAAKRVASVTPTTGTIFGVGAPFLQAGVPLIGFISGPWYMLTAPPGGELGKLSKDLFYGQLQTLTRSVAAIDGKTRAQLGKR